MIPPRMHTPHLRVLTVLDGSTSCCCNSTIWVPSVSRIYHPCMLNLPSVLEFPAALYASVLTTKVLLPRPAADALFESLMWDNSITPIGAWQPPHPFSSFVLLFAHAGRAKYRSIPVQRLGDCLSLPRLHPIPNSYPNTRYKETACTGTARMHVLYVLPSPYLTPTITTPTQTHFWSHDTHARHRLRSLAHSISLPFLNAFMREYSASLNRFCRILVLRYVEP